MEILQIKISTVSKTTNFIRVGDLSYFEGPLLVLFEDASNGHLFLFDWVDKDNAFNRWLVYRITPHSLLNFINGQTTHFELFYSNPDGKFYVTDIDNKHRITDYNLLELEEVPLKYYPNKENWFEAEDCPSVAKIQTAIFKALSRKKLDNEYLLSDVTASSLNLTLFKRTRVNKIHVLDSGAYIANKAYDVRSPLDMENQFENHYDTSIYFHSKNNMNSQMFKQKNIYV